MFIINVSEVFIKKFASGKTVHRKHLLPGELMLNFHKIQVPIKFRKKSVRCQTFTNYFFAKECSDFLLPFNLMPVKF